MTDSNLPHGTGAGLVPLWTVGTSRCIVSPFSSDPPFVVAIYEGEAKVLHREFPSHPSALRFAIERLRATVPLT